MSATILYWSLTAAQLMLSIAMALALLRMVFGPRAQDRVLGLDALYLNSMLLLLVFGIGSG
ncbi:MAG TPA: monovalent cation/H+ antiporter complex subunit F, partial [Mycoplana sp.]|nr:monovalent cation/H+ antiporter complex subunit F [Mycoplana sp.]